ncbi:Unknown protein, partial [Striga hermonthica]
TSQAATTPTTVPGTQEEDVPSYGGGGEHRDRAMERMAEQLRQLQEKVEGRPDRRARGHPFSRDILAAPLPASFQEINLIFYGSSDPSRHERAFENMSILHGYSDPTYLTLMAMRQGEKESLRKYVARYNQMCLEVPTAGDEVKARGLIRSLRPGPCRTSLTKMPARTYDEVLKRCKKYINLEETEAEFAKLEEVARPDQRKEKPNSPRRGSPKRNPLKNGSSKRASPRREGRKLFHGGREDRWQERPRLPNGQRYNTFTPINAQMGEVLAAIEEKLESKEVT